MDLELTGRVAVVTGASRGIGRAIAVALAREGARVVLCARGEKALAEALATVAAAGPGPHVAVAADVTTPEGVELVCERAEAQGGVSILVNNVGGSGARRFADADERDFETVLARNFWPALRMSRRLLPGMQARKEGSIILVSSIWGREAGGGPSYNVAKAAEISLAKAMAREVASDGVRVNSVAPGSILFPGGGWERRQQADPAGIADFIRRDLPFGRMGTPEEVANVVAFLASPRASWIAGACVVVDGGQSHAF